MFDRDYLDVAGFAALLRISERNARIAITRCARGLPYRGHLLEVIQLKGRRGRGGIGYRVHRQSIPAAWLVPASATRPERQEARALASLPIDGPAQLSSRPDALRWRIALIRRIIDTTTPGTSERRALIRQLANTERSPSGKAISVTTLYGWLKSYERRGVHGLGRKVRADAKARRVFLSRALDQELLALGESTGTLQELANDIRRFIRSMWRSGAPTWPSVREGTAGHIAKLLRARGSALHSLDLMKLCRLPRHVIERERAYRAVAIRRKDAGRSAAIQTPRTRRDRSMLAPMEWVAGDVHPVDILYKADADRDVTPKAVCWLDLATNRVHVTPFILRKGEGIRREHVIHSFVAMCSDPNWGAPSRIYIDHGREYYWTELAADILRLKSTIEVRGADELDGGTLIQRSRPYNPQSKTIETAFSILERSFFSQLRGHIGGNRMKSKTQMQGKAPDPHGSDEEALRASLAIAVEAYHNKPQSRDSHLRGSSPYEAFRRFIDAGWKSVPLDPLELSMAFSFADSRVVRAGGAFTWKSNRFPDEPARTYRHDALLALAGTGKVIVREPLFGSDRTLFLFTEDDNFIGFAEPAIPFAFDDIAGAKEQQRQASAFNRQIRDMEAETDALDLEQVMKDTVRAYGPAPQATASAVISINHRFRDAAAQAKTMGPAPHPDEAEHAQRKEYAQLEKLAALIRGGTED